MYSAEPWITPKVGFVLWDVGEMQRERERERERESTIHWVRKRLREKWLSYSQNLSQMESWVNSSSSIGALFFCPLSLSLSFSLSSFSHHPHPYSCSGIVCFSPCFSFSFSCFFFFFLCFMCVLRASQEGGTERRERGNKELHFNTNGNHSRSFTLSFVLSYFSLSKGSLSPLFSKFPLPDASCVWLHTRTWDSFTSIIHDCSWLRVRESSFAWFVERFWNKIPSIRTLIRSCFLFLWHESPAHFSMEWKCVYACLLVCVCVCTI